MTFKGGRSEFNCQKEDMKSLKIGDLGINRYSEITAQATTMTFSGYAAAVSVKLYHQPYLKFKNDTNRVYHDLQCEDSSSVAQVLKDIAK